MDVEDHALVDNYTWTVTPMPDHNTSMACKWVFKFKLNSDGTEQRKKAHLVAKEFTQQVGIDYEETFFPIAKLATIKTLLVVTAQRHWHLHQLDINNAFLHGKLDKEVYMLMPPSYKQQGKNGEKLLCKLKKSIYGLKQASRQWNYKLISYILSEGFTQSKSDYSLVSKQNGCSFTVLLIYVGDIIFGGNDLSYIELLGLNNEFKLKDLGVLKYFLGTEVARNSSGITICQRKYALEILSDASYLGAKPMSIALPQNLKLSRDKGELVADASVYR